MQKIGPRIDVQKRLEILKKTNALPPSRTPQKILIVASLATVFIGSLYAFLNTSKAVPILKISQPVNDPQTHIEHFPWRYHRQIIGAG
jgi:hypothetical protein